CQCLVWIGCLTAIASSAAIPETERAFRTQILRELDLVQELVDRAEAAPRTENGVRFRYDLLRTDLERVQAGIRVSLLPHRPEPRSLADPEGKYVP
ncbi:MAG: hypothetical protein J4F97_05110, partial [Pseudomonadales bacterium]|nr:hypothetical protein [Pseudomonadales bacterium]